MKVLKFIKHLMFMLTMLGLTITPRLNGQTFTTLHSFNGSDGTGPEASLVLLGNTIYGTAGGNGIDNIFGTWFAINTDGTGFTNLHYFTGGTAGAYPYESGLILSSNTLYGTVEEGGSGYSGTVSAMNTNGMDFTNLYNFTGGDDGFYPRGGVVISSNKLYGTANGGGAAGFYGTVFAVNTDGTGFTNLHSFTATSGGVGSGTNSDGANPQAGVILSGDMLYGTTLYGGSYGYGTVFAINIDGTDFTNLHNFTGGNDGAHPVAGLIISGNILYGTAEYGGGSGNGTVFALNTNGMGFTNLYSFSMVSTSFPFYANGDGANPEANLIISGNTLYGTASSGGTNGDGSVFAVNTDGTGFTNLYSFVGGNDGSNPFGGLIISGNTLYGTAEDGGTNGDGTVFSLSLPLPQLTITTLGTNVILTWPTNAAGFDYSRFTLQSTIQLGISAPWNFVLPLPVIVNGQNAVTNPISDTQQFYRLSQSSP
jgi:uncharacterized repeat protein (TIGR03803 family)